MHQYKRRLPQDNRTLISPNWNQEYGFRVYPPLVDSEYLFSLPDPLKWGSTFYSIISPTKEVSAFFSGGADGSLLESSFKRIDFKIIEFAYEKNNYIVRILDWEQIR